MNIKLEKYVGEIYKEAEDGVWYIPKDTNNLKYLIKQDNNGEYSLWVFSAFEVENGNTYTYGYVMKTIYGVQSAEDIESIITTPSNSNNTDYGREIQKKIGTEKYTDRSSIEAFYNIVQNVVCYGENAYENAGDNRRFEYSFSTDAEDKLHSGESTYGTRFLKVTLKDGTTIDSWKYSALSGAFYEYGGIFTQPLPEEEVYTLNEIFGIK